MFVGADADAGCTAAAGACVAGGFAVSAAEGEAQTSFSLFNGGAAVETGAVCAEQQLVLHLGITVCRRSSWRRCGGGGGGADGGAEADIVAPMLWCLPPAQRLQAKRGG